MSEEKYIAVIGGLNLDIAGLSGPEYREYDSNIGDIIINTGGVGHNIALNLVNLEVPTYLLTVYGDDYFGQILKRESLESGIKLDYAEEIPGASSSTYLYVTDNHGDMVTAINDMDIVDLINPEFLEARLDFINQAALVVVDGNLSQEAIEWLTDHVTVPIFVDPVSVAKAGRFSQVLDKIDTIKPNEHEVELYTGIKVTDLDSAKEAAQAMLDKGVKNVYISLGKQGILGGRQGEFSLVKPLPDIQIKSTNGAGDTTMATIAWARYQYGEVLSIEEVSQFSQAASSIALESNEACSPDLNVRDVIKRAVKTYGE